MDIYYVYAYINSNTNLPYYIGKGKNDRAYKNHGRIKTPKDKSKIVFLEKNLTNTGALALERRYIKWYGRKDNKTGILLNKTDGGDGAAGKDNGMYGKSRPDLSERNKNNPLCGELNPMYGKKRKDLSEYNKTNKKGKPISEEHRLKIKNHPKYVCENCGGNYSKGNYRRWHGNNCKLPHYKS